MNADIIVEGKSIMSVTATGDHCENKLLGLSGRSVDVAQEFLEKIAAELAADLKVRRAQIRWVKKKGVEVQGRLEV
jgi:hypothetical protein